jgi:ATP-binding cassette subfamily F protein uup
MTMTSNANRGAPLLTLSDLAMAYGERVLFEGLSFALYAGDKVGLIGDNGVGKSTLLKLIAQKVGQREGLKPLRGEIALRTGARIGVLDQVPDLPRDQTIGQVLADGLGPLIATLEAWEKAVAELDPKADQLLSKIEMLGGFDYQHKIESIHEELDLPPLDRTIGTLSGGQMKRVAIGRLVLENPDIVLYDEPTNHLDVETIEWLERYIANSPAAALVVTHDRAFLDTAVTIMAELRGGRRLTGTEAERGALAVYPGTYEDYLEARALEEEQRAALGQSKAQLLKGELEWSRRQPKARTVKSQARLDRVASLSEEVSGLKQKAQVADFDFGQGAKRLTKSVLALEGATFGYDTPLARDLDLALIRGERLGVVGKNGIGKTSLLKVMAGELPLMSGHRELGPETVIATFDQHRMVLDDQQSIQRVVAPDGNDTVFPGGKPMHVAGWLARFAFNARHLPMAVSSLSGGERNRLALARFLLEPANVLLLDEPTNDLDLQTLAILEEAVLGFGGTVVVVSHDRWFLDRVATRLMVFEDLPPATFGADPIRHVHIQPGGWSTYRRLRMPEVELAWATHKEREKAQAKASAKAAQKSAPAPTKPSLTGAEKKELASLEKQIEAIEAKKAGLEDQLTHPEVWEGEGRRGRELTTKKEQLEAELASLIARWEALAERA